MPRFFYHIQDGRSIPDREGTELPDAKTARMEAISTGGSILKETAIYWDGTEWTMIVVDEAGKTILKMRFSAEIDPAQEPA